MKQICAPEEFDKVRRLDGTFWEITLDEDPTVDWDSDEWTVFLSKPGDELGDEEVEQESDVTIEWDTETNEWVETA